MPMNSEFHALKAEEVVKALESSLQGLSQEEAESRLKEFGPNELREKKGTTALSIFLGQFKSIFVIMLIVAAVTSGLVDVYFENSTPIDAFVIFAIVAMNSTVGFVQEYRSEKAMEAMKKLTAPKARVKRNGKETMTAAREVVPGDIVLLEAGDRVPADARLIEAADLRTDEAVLTGESTPVEKGTSALRVDTHVADRKNTIFMATHILYGRGKAVVTSTGMNTEFGKVAEMVQASADEETPLKLKLERFSKKLAIIISIVCVAIFLLQGFRGQPLVESFMIAVALAVSAVPEGLPAIVTVTLALGARDLAKRNAVVRRLTSVETLGSTTVICSDKTGTLTKGEMTVREICVNGQTVEVTGVGYERRGEFRIDNTPINLEESSNLQLLLRIGTLCNNASYDGQRIFGDPTEGALIVAGTKAGLWQDEMQKLYPRVDEIAFSSERKRMATIHQTPEGGLVAYVKGAPEVILQLCEYVYDNGRAKKLTIRKKQQLLKTNETMAGRALRVLGMAYKTLPNNLKDFKEETVENHLVFVGLVGMIDPPREEAKEANN
ncbi:MAG: HAD-IC family P-type ATPase, partial [Candidatus Bathyarchaeota archaeon]|nr:HAD-IC family P-type ATPase [Candidatus Bathyarchaeota archaeon]